MHASNPPHLETRAINRQHGEAQKRKKDVEKRHHEEKRRRRERFEKQQRERERQGLPSLPSPMSSSSEEEGDDSWEHGGGERREAPGELAVGWRQGLGDGRGGEDAECVRSAERIRGAKPQGVRSPEPLDSGSIWRSERLRSTLPGPARGWECLPRSQEWKEA